MKQRKISVKQYTNEIKLMSLVPERVKQAKIQENFLVELEYIQKSKKMTFEQKAQLVTRALKKSMTEAQWGSVKHVLSGKKLSEGEFGNMSDQQVADMIAQAAKELESKADNPAVDPSTIDGSDINLDMIKDPAKADEPQDLIKKEWFNKKKPLVEKVLLKEFAITVTVLLAAPTILKGIASVIDWIAGLISGTPESRGMARVYRKIYTVAHKKKIIPSQVELDKELGGIWSSLKSGVSYASDKDYTAKVYDEIAAEASKLGATFDAKSTEPQPVSGELMHYIEEKSSYSKLGGWLKHKAHQLHELYIIPIQAVLFGVSALLAPGQVAFRPKATWEKCHQVAEWIYSLGMLVIAIYGGIHAWHDLAHSAPELAQHVTEHAPKLASAFTVLVDAIKAGDMSVSVISKIAGAFA